MVNTNKLINLVDRLRGVPNDTAQEAADYIEESSKSHEELSGSEAVVGFCGWLTTRKGKTVMGSGTDCTHIANLIQVFCDENSLSAPVDGWEDKLKHPNS